MRIWAHFCSSTFTTTATTTTTAPYRSSNPKDNFVYKHFVQKIIHTHRTIPNTIKKMWNKIWHDRTWHDLIVVCLSMCLLLRFGDLNYSQLVVYKRSHNQKLDKPEYVCVPFHSSFFFQTHTQTLKTFHNFFFSSWIYWFVELLMISYKRRISCFLRLWTRIFDQWYGKWF